MDARLLRSNGRVADVSLDGKVDADAFVQPVRKRISLDAVSATLAQTPGGGRAKDMVAGRPFDVLEVMGDLAFGFDPEDGYVGYLAAELLEDDVTPTHRIAAPGSHTYPKPNMKSGYLGYLSMGSRVHGDEIKDQFLQVGDLWVPLQHVRPIDELETDPASVALRLLHTPYVWGGNTSTGIDCSGMTQLSLELCGVPCPRDSDQQEASFEAVEGSYQRGDLVFWKGHVGMLLDADTLIHANAHHMAVAIEPLDEAIARIAKREFGEVTKVARPVLP